MELSEDERKVVERALEVWTEEGLLTREKSGELRSSILVKRPAGQVAHYFFLIALSCSLLAFGAIFIDERLLEKIRQHFALSHLFIAALMASLAVVWFYYIGKRAKQSRSAAFEIYLVLGALASITALVYLCKEIGFGKSYSLFCLLCTLLLLALSIRYRSRTLWLGTILSLMALYGSVTYAYSEHHLFLGMNYPVRFTVFGAILLAASRAQTKVGKLAFTQPITYVAALLILFTGLWGVSVFGNYHDLNAWMAVRQTHVMIYGFLFGAACLLSLYLGIRYHDDTARDFGILFLLINFYSRYFEYFWNTLHKGLFFLLLAISFWLLGKYLERRKKKGQNPP